MTGLIRLRLKMKMSLKEKVSFLVFFGVGAPVLMIAEIFLLVKIINQQLALDDYLPITISVVAQDDFSQQPLASNHLANSSVKGVVITGDARPILIRNYLKKYQSPLTPYADFIFATSQKYGIDYRLLVAIAQQESNLCKKIPPNSHNCWGWGIHSKGTLGFSSFDEAIEIVAQGLKEDYIDKGFTTVE